MEIQIEHNDRWTIVRPAGPRIDTAAAPALKSTFADLANEGRFLVVLNLRQISFIDSSGLGALIHAHKTVEGRGRLVLCEISPKIRPVLQLTRLDRLFAIAVDEAAAATILRA